MPRFNQRLSRDEFTQLQERVLAELTADGLDAILTDDPEDVAYLTGFFHHPGERPVAVLLGTDLPATLLVPVLEQSHAQHQDAAARIVTFAEYPGEHSPFEPLLAGRKLPKRLGVSPELTLHRLALLRQVLPDTEFVRTYAVTRARYVKLPGEIALHREAARITDIMLDAGITLVTDAIAAGGELPSEAELAGHVGSVGTSVMYGEHDDVVVVSFMAGGLVYAGPNSAVPHGLPSSYRLRAGDTFQLSLGCAVGGRFVEGERTFVLGEPSAEQRRYHNAVRDAQAEGSAAIAPGVRCDHANERTLAVLHKAGLSDYILHRQGHGIGLGMHEPPWLAPGDDTLLQPGMICSNEPGIYVPGHAGYRISDSMLVTETGSEPLTSYPRSLEDCIIDL